MKVAILAFALIIGHVVASPTELPAQDAVVLSSSDSAAILHAAWRVATAGHSPRRILWLWVPSVPDTGSTVPISPSLRWALLQRRLPASERRPAGDDTVVVRLTRWDTDTAGVVLELRSEWTTVLGSGERRCRTGSGNVEQLRVRRRSGEWQAEWAGPVLHGDRLCRPIDSKAAAPRDRL